jgi:hypothetical protein
LAQQSDLGHVFLDFCILVSNLLKGGGKTELKLAALILSDHLSLLSVFVIVLV